MTVMVQGMERRVHKAKEKEDEGGERNRILESQTSSSRQTKRFVNDALYRGLKVSPTPSPPVHREDEHLGEPRS
jgi:hypothetical protein